jgi:putative transposase
VRGRRGSVFAERYHAHVLRHPREVRNAIAYVLSNWRRHREDAHCSSWPIDPYSSALGFDGWRRDASANVRDHPAWRLGDAPPVAAPRFWLLVAGWRRGGLLDPSATPGPRTVRRP